MKLILAIMSNDDSPAVSSALTKENYQVTRLATTGGFLRAGNTTLLLGVEDEKLSTALGHIEKICKSRRQFVNSNMTSLDPAMGMGLPSNIEIMVGGATVFVLDVQQFQKY